MSPIIDSEPAAINRVITFHHQRPPARFPPILDPWITATIQQAATETGTYTNLETITLDPVDFEPRWPRSWSFSAIATLAELWKRIVWTDADGNTFTTEPLFDDAGSTTSSWAPTVQDIADLSHAYTRPPIDSEGEQAGAAAGVFDDRTDPTADQVAGYIAVAVGEVSSRVNVSNERLEKFPDLAKRTAAWHAASTVEAEKSPEGAAETNGAHNWKWSSYVACLNELIAQARPKLVR